MISNDKKAELNHLAVSGDIIAQALLYGVSDMTVTVGAESSNSIVVTVQTNDGAKMLTVESYPTAGTGLLTDGGAGTMPIGTGTKSGVFVTDVTGKAQIAVANANAEDNYLRIISENGDIKILKLTFA